MTVQATVALDERVRRASQGIMISKGSITKVYLPEAVKYARDHGAVLQSAREAAALRVITSGSGFDHSGEDQATRTAILYFIDKDRYCFAVDDEPDDSNIILSRAQDGYSSCYEKGVWILPKSDSDVAKILRRAERSGRIGEINIPNIETQSLYVTGFQKVSLQPNFVRLGLGVNNLGQCDFTSDGVVRATLGDYTTHYTDLLRGAKHKTAELRTYPRTEYPGSKGMLMDGFYEAMSRRICERVQDFVQVRAVFLSRANGIYARANFDSLGFARGLVNAEPS